LGCSRNSATKRSILPRANSNCAPVIGRLRKTALMILSTVAWLMTWPRFATGPPKIRESGVSSASCAETFKKNRAVPQDSAVIVGLRNYLDMPSFFIPSFIMPSFFFMPMPSSDFIMPFFIFFFFIILSWASIGLVVFIMPW
jgi:hypothetical protein